LIYQYDKNEIITNFEKNEDFRKILFKIFSDVISEGGFFEYIGKNKFKNNPFEINDKDLREIYNKYLFHFELFDNLINVQKGKASRYIMNYTEEDLIKFDPSMILECKIIEANNNDSLTDITNKIKEAYKHDLVILRGFTEKFGLNESLFNINHIEDNSDKYENLKIDIINQNPNFYGFTSNKHKLIKTKILTYLKYVRQKSSFFNNNIINHNNPNKENETKNDYYLNGNLNINGNIDNLPINPKFVNYAVNVNLDGLPELKMELKSKLHPLINFQSEFDILKYVRNQIEGMTLPQMYIKVPGVWTGGHEENLRMRSININHGPGDSLWWASPRDESNKIFTFVKDKYDMDIYQNEGIYFPNFEFFLTNNTKTIYTRQKKGDIVLVGIGSIHW
jgi:hypothetical protein